jgi:hypothetical protein
MIKSRRMGCAGYVGSMRRKRKAHRIFVKEAERKRPLRRP